MSYGRKASTSARGSLKSTCRSARRSIASGDATGELEQKTKEQAAALRSAEQEGTSFARAFATGLADASREGAGFLGIIAEIGERLADLATNRLIDIFAGQVGGAIGAHFAGGGGAGASSGGGPTPLFPAGVLHGGGIVGEGGRARLVDPALFADARRYHGGGMVLRPNEVPIIAERGERITPAGQAGGPTTIVKIENHSGGAVEHRQSRGPGGQEIHTVIIRRVDNAVAAGEFDKSMRARYGLVPS